MEFTTITESVTTSRPRAESQMRPNTYQHRHTLLRPLVNRLHHLSHQIPIPHTHRGNHIPEFFASHPGGDSDGDGGSPDLERSHVPAGSDQMGLSTDIWLSPFLHVKVYHGSRSVDSPQPSGSLCSGRRPWGKSLKNNSLNRSSLYLGKVTVISINIKKKPLYPEWKLCLLSSSDKQLTANEIFEIRCIPHVSL